MSLSYTEYRLRFPGALRQSESHLGAYPALHADWLLQAVRSGYRKLTGADLPGWPDRSAVRVSSAFPYFGADSLLPAPTGGTDALIRLDGSPAPAGTQDAWTTVTRNRARMDRTTRRRETRFAVVETFFREGAGLWFGARFSSDAGPTARRTFEAVLRLLGDEGIGGGRSTGGGRFFVEAPRAITVADPAAGQVLLCLSRYRPTDAEYAGGALLGPRTRWDQQAVRGTPLACLAPGTLLKPHDGFNPLQAGEAVPVGDDHRGLFAFVVPVPDGSTMTVAVDSDSTMSKTSMP